MEAAPPHHRNKVIVVAEFSEKVLKHSAGWTCTNGFVAFFSARPTLPEAVKVMARVQLGVTLDDADIRDIVAFLDSLTGELPANFATAPVLPSGAVVPTK